MASVPVNPPPLLKIPRAFLQDREVRAFIEQQNIILFQLWKRSGGDGIDLTELIEIVNGIIEDLTALTLQVEANTLNIAKNADDIAENTQEIDELAKFAGLVSKVEFCQQQIDGLPVFTIDTSGFTTDTSLITTDKSIA